MAHLCLFQNYVLNRKIKITGKEIQISIKLQGKTPKKNSMILVVFLQGQTSVNINAELNWQFLLKSSAIDLFLNNVLLQKNPQNWLHFDNS